MGSNDNFDDAVPLYPWNVAKMSVYVRSKKQQLCRGLKFFWAWCFLPSSVWFMPKVSKIAQRKCSDHVILYCMHIYPKFMLFWGLKNCFFTYSFHCAVYNLFSKQFLYTSLLCPCFDVVSWKSVMILTRDKCKVCVKQVFSALLFFTSYPYY